MPNKPKPPLPKAASLKYDQVADAAPKVTAKGRGIIAEKILELAQENNIPIHQDANLMEVLDTIEVDQEIPLEVYAVVAEVFRYIYDANKSKIAQRKLAPNSEGK